MNTLIPIYTYKFNFVILCIVSYIFSCKLCTPCLLQQSYCTRLKVSVQSKIIKNVF
ncbi:hypothetical protein C0J52_06001 [Blattella germanica]|nr:hypothetical protein C0J52_06001 [Blattella germanica]